MRHFFVLFILCLSLQGYADVTTHVIDTGAGLATVTRFPDDSIMVYDTGHWSPQRSVFERFREIIGDDDVDLLIVSRTDADHLSATDELFNEYRVHRVLRTGMDRSPGGTNWRNHVRAVEEAAEAGLTHDVNLATTNLPFGTNFNSSTQQKHLGNN